MAKASRSTINDKLTKEQEAYVMENLNNMSISQIAKQLKCDEKLVNDYISEIVKKPGHGLSRSTYLKKSGVTAATQSSSERGDAARNNSGISKYQKSIHRPLG